MKTTFTIQSMRRMVLMGLTVAALLCPAREGRAEVAHAPQAEEALATTAQPSDAALPPGAARLASLAFEASSKMPSVPHAKTRARLQEFVVEACAKTGLMKSGLAFAERIEGWQQGVGMTRLALASAASGKKLEAHLPLERAMAHVADGSTTSFPQTWQRDRVRAGIAGTLVWLGREKETAAFESNLEHSEAGVSLIARAETCALEAFDQEVAAIEQFIATNDFDRLRHAVLACAALTRRFKTDHDKVRALEARVQSVAAKFPAASRFDALTLLAECAIERSDAASAKSFLGEASTAIPPTSLSAAERIPLLGRVAVLHHRLGHDATAHSQFDEAHELFAKNRTLILDIARAAALRGLAEAAESAGRHELALQLWDDALAEGWVNPNARPRAEDLVLTCCSILRSGVAPTKALLERSEVQLKGLSDPW